MDVKIINTGSKGNCAVIDDVLIIDAGWNVMPEGNAVFLTHQHTDHTKHLDNMTGLPIYALEATAEKLMKDPRFAYTAFNLIKAGEPIVVYASSVEYHVVPFDVNHDVPCVGFDITKRNRILEDETRIFWATDFNTLGYENGFIDNLRKKVYDAIYIEANNTLNQTDFMDVFFPEEGAKEPRDAFHRSRSFNTHCNVDYLIHLFTRAGYSERKKFTEPVTLLHKSSYYYPQNPDRVVDLCKMVNIINPLY